MEKLVFFGKGGIGKSTTSSNLSATLAAMGRRVLHVGCDPKHDSTVSLLHGELIMPVVDRITTIQGVKPEDIVRTSPLGVDCVEAGGPEAGVGCGGRGISRMLEIFAAARLLAPGRYDVAVYDVLGDVVCGGFAAPLRTGIGEKVVIVVSEEVMALYAANNIARAVVHYAENGVHLAGIVVNARDGGGDLSAVERFAGLINTRILGVIPRDLLVREAEYRRMTVVEYAPGAAITRVFRELADTLLALDASACPLPTPLDEARFYELTRYKFAPPPGGLGAPAPAAPPPDMVPAARLIERPAAPAIEVRVDRRADLAAELRAGALAVRLGKVSADEALRRLKEDFPREARALTRGDLLS
ncbi:MAG: AAA family ATPase [Byssovorax sp.]